MSVNFGADFEDWEVSPKDVSLGDKVKVYNGYKYVDGKIQWIDRVDNKVSILLDKSHDAKGYKIVDIEDITEILDEAGDLIITEDNYRDFPAINQSKLSKLRQHPSLVQQESKATEYTNFGSLVDDLCFDFNNVEEKYYIDNGERSPSSTAQDLADYLLEQPEHNLVLKDDEIVCKNTKYGLEELLEIAEDAVGSSTSFEKYGGVSYLKTQIASEEKTVIPRDDYREAMEIVKALKQTDYTANFFKKNHELPDAVDIFHQFPIVFPVDEEQHLGKGLLDIVVINHKAKAIYPIDLKTTSTHLGDFYRKFKEFGYYLQSSFYTEAVKLWRRAGKMNQFTHSQLGPASGSEKLTGYEVKPFSFIVASRKTPDKPVRFACTENDIKVGKYGGETKSGEQIRGWLELFEDLMWHIENDKWDHPREFYEGTKGTMKLDVFKDFET